MMKTDDPVVVIGYARTPVGSFGKSLAGVPAHVLGATAAKAALERAGLTPADAQEWIIGCVGSTGTDAYISRRVSIRLSRVLRERVSIRIASSGTSCLSA